MLASANKSWYHKRRKKYISQGDIIRELDITISSQISGADFSLTPSFSYGVILSQDCDLEQHYNLIEKNLLIEDSSQHVHDKVIETVLVCPAFPADQFILGNHISGKKMNDFQGTSGQRKAKEKLIRNDEYNRFHYLPNLENGFPELIVDFKRFYTIPIGIFDKNIKKFYISSLKDLYKERLSQRFTNYLARIGLPDNTSV